MAPPPRTPPESCEPSWVYGMEDRPVAITVHRVPRKEVCGVVVLVRQADGSWSGKCSKCGGDFHVEKDSKFEAQVRAMRN